MSIQTDVPEILQLIHQEWARPCSVWWCGDAHGRETRYAGAVAIQTTEGWLLLTNVYRVMDGPNSGQVRRKIVKISECTQLTRDEESFP